MAKDTVKAKFGDTVRMFRQRVGISQEELAARSGLHRTYVSDIERGSRNLSLINIVRLAKALHVKPADLMKNLE